MVAKLEAKYKEHKDDAVNLLILISIASALGVYLIATTVLVPKDAVYYIELARKLSSYPLEVVQTHPPGYPFLISVTHKIAGLFTDSPSAQTWVYSAQSITLLCRLLAIIPLYCVGRLLVGSRDSFWALLILILLPYPAEFGSDALKDWPYALFLAAGFLFLLLGAAQVKWWMFGVAGLAAGLGYMIRPTCAQLVIYGVLWLLIRLLPAKHNLSKARVVFAMLVLLIGFAVPVVPYMKARGRIMPEKLEGVIGSSCESQSERAAKRDIESDGAAYATAGLPDSMAKAVITVIEGVNENLFYFFVPPLLVGAYLRFRRRLAATGIEKFFVPAFVVFNIIMLVLLHCNYGYISRRHVLPLVLFTIFYVPAGLQALGDWLERGICKGRPPAEKDSQRWFFILLAIGFAVCLPKLLRPIGADKRGFRAAAKWLKANTSREDAIAVPDRRISFCAERRGLMYEENVPEEARYVVRIVKGEDEKPDAGESVRKELSLWVDQRKKRRKIVIYKVL
ncbi:MAG: glycosyltransferase family 39 protein [Planctomycetota bacterium]|jgi:4-amino-4-deoxy-L-arabinose transferase-like glycosyltransferase